MERQRERSTKHHNEISSTIINDNEPWYVLKKIQKNFDSNQPPWWWPWGEHRGREWLASAGLRGWPPGTRCGGNGHGSHGARVNLQTWWTSKSAKIVPIYHVCLVVWIIFISIYIYIGNNHPNWLIFFRGVETLYHVLGAKINGGSEQLGMVFSPSKWLWPPETTWDERNAQKGDTWETWWDRSGHNWWPS